MPPYMFSPKTNPKQTYPTQKTKGTNPINPFQEEINAQQKQRGQYCVEPAAFQHVQTP
jgi:hypothetical protein